MDRKRGPCLVNLPRHLAIMGDGVVSVAAKGMTTAESAEAEPAPPGETMANHGLGRVVRAPGHEPAGTREPR